MLLSVLRELGRPQLWPHLAVNWQGVFRFRREELVKKLLVPELAVEILLVMVAFGPVSICPALSC